MNHYEKKKGFTAIRYEFPAQLIIDMGFKESETEGQNKKKIHP